MKETKAVNPGKTCATPNRLTGDGHGWLQQKVFAPKRPPSR